LKSIQKKDFMVAGTVAKTHGTKGELKIVTDIKVKLTEWAFLEIREKPVPFYIEQAHAAHHDEWLVKLQDINTVENAQLYVGYKLLVPKPKGKRKANVGEFNLTGFKLVDINLGDIGEIVATEELPQQTMLVTHYKEQQVMIPMVEAFIHDVDEEQEIIYLNLPEGFFELYE
jgi:16S rRNA processing protein RimM